ncbi:MAG: mechanosensitive ion channel family protein [Alphaproteobacteria bacterium]
MIEKLYSFYAALKIGHHLSSLATTLTVVVVTAAAGVMIHKILSRAFFKRFQLFVVRHYPETEKIIAEISLLRRLLMVAVPLILFLMLPLLFGSPEELALKKILKSIEKILITYILCLFAILANTIMNGVEKAYQRRPKSQRWPIRSYVQFVKIFIFFVFGILIISHLLDKSPLTFLTGLGAAMAIITMVFKDSLLSFVSSVQLASSNMMQKGDWIEIPEKNISGHIIEMSLHTIKVQNFDKTISTIPPYYVTTNVVKNWRGMFEFGGRRFQTHLVIDNHTIKFLDDSLSENLKKIPVMDFYLKQNKETTSLPLTNLGLFRIYIEALLEQDNRFLKTDVNFMARILKPQSNGGLPVEVYAYTKETALKPHEHIQAELVEHLIAILPQFELKVLQED